MLQYLDAKPFDCTIDSADFVPLSTGEWCYQETRWRANGRVSINVYAQQSDGTWAEVVVANGIDAKRRFWVVVSSPAPYRVVAR
ncbi:hypothetical protein [Curtobacterium sp. 8I-2]|uniref:hypothetical protein n=1 Tax=Curtobacterium sp. 8I-2 TaxID=2653136 RepID=UPI00135A270C|nr:hypothetical protein [Curtobacterium sp. 8I-2]